MNYVIFDLDNCISADDWRIKFIDWTPGLTPDERYRPYHQRCYGDEPRNMDVVLNHYQHGEQPIFFTARPEEVRAMTQTWLLGVLRGVGIPTDSIPFIVLMRQEREFVGSVELKAAMLRRFRADIGVNDSVVAAYDDRLDVVQMYSAAGVNSTVLKIHDVCAYTNPLTQEMPNGR